MKAYGWEPSNGLVTILPRILTAALGVATLSVVFFAVAQWVNNGSHTDGPPYIDSPSQTADFQLTQTPDPLETSLPPTDTDGENTQTVNPSTETPGSGPTGVSTISPTPGSTSTASSQIFPADWLKLISSSPTDGAYFAPQDGFSKTWTVKNTGTRTWTEDYDLVFFSGTRMTDKKVFPLTTTVKPGRTITLKLNLTAPKTPGVYQGSWMLRNERGILFGLGEDGDDPLQVKITVLNVNPDNSYDFLLNYCNATWWNGSGQSIYCDGTPDYTIGFVRMSTLTALENGLTDKPVLWVHPEYKQDGIISGRYPAYVVQTGDHFRAKVGCLSGYTKCNLTFKFMYRIVGGSNQSLGSWNEVHDGGVSSIDIDLSFLAGKKVEFLLQTICNNKYPGNAHGFWLVPRIIKVEPSPTPTSSPTSTATETATHTPTATATPTTPVSTEIPETETPVVIPTPTGTPTPTSTPTSPTDHTDWFELVSTSPIDGAYLAPQTGFMKIWTVKNTGTRTWTEDYDLVFISGTQMTDKALIPLTGTVQPGETLELSINMESPKTPGDYQGFWMLRNDHGDLIGMGEDVDEPLKVNITVLNVNPNNSYDFLLSYCDAIWWNSSGESISCNGVSNEISGFVRLEQYPLLETGPSDKPVLWVHPENELDGTISGRFPAYTVSEGDHFTAQIGCIGGYPSCNITFKLLYRIGNNPNQLLETWQETYGDGITAIDIDLTPLAGQKVEFVLRTICTGTSPSNAQGFWMTPGIEYIKPAATPTPPPDATPIPTDIPL